MYYSSNLPLNVYILLKENWFEKKIPYWVFFIFLWNPSSILLYSVRKVSIILIKKSKIVFWHIKYVYKLSLFSLGKVYQTLVQDYFYDFMNLFSLRKITFTLKSLIFTCSSKSKYSTLFLNASIFLQTLLKKATV